jgi:hypothetical protein
MSEFRQRRKSIRSSRPAVAVPEVLPAEYDTRLTSATTAIRARVLRVAVSEAIPPEQLEPKHDQRGRAEGRGDDYQKGGERLVPARRQPRQLRLHEVALSRIMAKSCAWVPVGG